MTGIITRYDEERGFGWISPMIGKPGETERVWFHASAICRTQDGYKPALPSGVEVSFTLARAEGGKLQAANIRVRTVGAEELLKCRTRNSGTNV